MNKFIAIGVCLCIQKIYTMAPSCHCNIGNLGTIHAILQWRGTINIYDLLHPPANTPHLLVDGTDVSPHPCHLDGQLRRAWRPLGLCPAPPCPCLAPAMSIGGVHFRSCTSRCLSRRWRPTSWNRTQFVFCIMPTSWFCWPVTDTCLAGWATSEDPSFHMTELGGCSVWMCQVCGIVTTKRSPF